MTEDEIRPACHACEVLDQVELSIEDEKKIAALRVPIPRNERVRILRIRQLCMLDTPEEAVFDSYTSLAARYFKVPVAMFSLIDIERAWLKSKVGVGNITEGPRDLAFCSYTILEETPKVMVVPDATKDPRFCSNPHVADSMGIRFYAGCSVEVDGVKLGTFCIVDMKPHLDFSAEDENILKGMCEIVESLILVRKKKLLSLENDQARLISLVLRDLQHPIKQLREMAASLESSLSSEHTNIAMQKKVTKDFRRCVVRLEKDVERQLELAILLTTPDAHPSIFHSSPPPQSLASSSSCSLYPPNPPSLPYSCTSLAGVEDELILTSESWLKGLGRGVLRAGGDAGKEAGSGERRGRKELLLHKRTYRLLSLLIPLLHSHYRQQEYGEMEVRGEIRGPHPSHHAVTQGEVVVRILPPLVDDKMSWGDFERYLLTLLQGVRVSGVLGVSGKEGVGIVLSFPCLLPPIPPSPSQTKEEAWLCMWGCNTMGNGKSGCRLFSFPWPFPALRSVASRKVHIHPARTNWVACDLTPSVDSLEGVWGSEGGKGEEMGAESSVENRLVAPSWDSELRAF